MKHSSLCVCVGTLLVATPLMLLAYRAHEVSVAMQSMAANHYDGSINFDSTGLVWMLSPLIAGAILIAYGMICGALESRHRKDRPIRTAEVDD